METFLKIEIGSVVKVSGQDCRIEHILDAETVVITDLQTIERRRANIAEIDSKSDTSVPIDMLDEDERKEAIRRFNIIAPIIRAQVVGGKDGRVAKLVQEACEQHDVSKSTIYSWIKQYSFCERISDLVPDKPGPKVGNFTLKPEREELLCLVIEKQYLTAQRKSIPGTIDAVELAFRKSGMQAPHPNTVRNRIRSLNRRFTAAIRTGNMMKKIPPRMHRESNILGVESAGVYQIDHTPVDAILVDEEYRLPIGRPWLTLALSPVTRIVAGVYISLDPPGDVSVGQCLVNAILPKQPYLQHLGLDDQLFWPVWGLPTGVHADNAGEFKGNLLQETALDYKFRIEWRSVKKPENGAHVERIMGTVMKRVHDIPGTTFSNIQERAEYDSDGNAILTTREFEEWLMLFILKYYHNRKHPGLGMSPLEKYNEVIFGTENSPGRGLPFGVSDPRRLKLDFLPSIRRVVRPEGVEIDGIFYSADALSPWIGIGPDEKTKLHQFKRDPRCISPIYFYDPKIDDYIEVPFRQRSRKPASIWELREAKRRLKDSGRDKYTESELFDALEQMEEILNKAAEKSKSARKQVQAKKDRDRKQSIYAETSNACPSEDGSDPQPSSETVEMQKYDLDEDDDYEATIID
ncbi:Mu transposase C-terminal domain-containing protein [Coraliomargarita sp. SDUM461003]|uniref:Mu transposase C-terminal domain-containing protein n=1 Tax=Thalassobacterium maritimum TaxID=3041265 RepID=A0ABU1ANZ6_9BACT|nr:Mu transposase C-terminal domain-containing protein [Coraliomargarita sp. SDUM461003]MDQ8205905.1 Mu transposase C-terminal domain-containing protein [Coraliomargarita sp. SDUM461003]